MSDFSQFKDELLNGSNKYFITENTDGTKNIVLANEIINEGTEFNKTNISDKIGYILGYNELEVDHDELYNNISFTANGVPENFVENQRILVTPKLNTVVPPKEYNTLSETQLFTENFFSNKHLLKFIRLNENRLFWIYSNQYDNRSGYYFVSDNDYNYITTPNSLGSGRCFGVLDYKKLEDGNNMFVIQYQDTSGATSYYIYYLILTDDGELVSQSEKFGNYISGNGMLLENNEVIGFRTHYTGDETYLYYSILSSNGNVRVNNVQLSYRLIGNAKLVKDDTHIYMMYDNHIKIADLNFENVEDHILTSITGSGGYDIAIINDKILITRQESGSVYPNVYLTVLDKNLNHIKTSFITDRSGNSVIKPLQDGKVVVITDYITSSGSNYSKATLFDNDFNLVKTISISGYDYTTSVSVEEINDFIVLLNTSEIQSSGTVTLYIKILNSLTFDTLYSSSESSSYMANNTIIPTSNTTFDIIGSKGNAYKKSIEFVNYEVKNITFNDNKLDTLLLRDKYYELLMTKVPMMLNKQWVLDSSGNIIINKDGIDITFNGTNSLSGDLMSVCDNLENSYYEIKLRNSSDIDSLVIDLKEVKPIYKIDVKTFLDLSGYTNLILQYSEDGDVWTTLENLKTDTFNNNLNILYYDNNISARYIRLYINSGNNYYTVKVYHFDVCANEFDTKFIAKEVRV